MLRLTADYYFVFLMFMSVFTLCCSRITPSSHHIPYLRSLSTIKIYIWAIKMLTEDIRFQANGEPLFRVSVMFTQVFPLCDSPATPNEIHSICLRPHLP